MDTGYLWEEDQKRRHAEAKTERGRGKCSAFSLVPIGGAL